MLTASALEKVCLSVCLIGLSPPSPAPPGNWVALGRLSPLVLGVSPVFRFWAYRCGADPGAGRLVLPCTQGLWDAKSWRVGHRPPPANRWPVFVGQPQEPSMQHAHTFGLAKAGVTSASPALAVSQGLLLSWAMCSRVQGSCPMESFSLWPLAIFLSCADLASQRCPVVPGLRPSLPPFPLSEAAKRALCLFCVVNSHVFVLCVLDFLSQRIFSDGLMGQLIFLSLLSSFPGSFGGSRWRTGSAVMQGGSLSGLLLLMAAPENGSCAPSFAVPVGGPCHACLNSGETTTTPRVSLLREPELALSFCRVAVATSRHVQILRMGLLTSPLSLC